MSPMLKPSRNSWSTSREGFQRASQCIRRYRRYLRSSASSSNAISIWSSESSTITGGSWSSPFTFICNDLNIGCIIPVMVSAADTASDTNVNAIYGNILYNRLFTILSESVRVMTGRHLPVKNDGFRKIPCMRTMVMGGEM